MPTALITGASSGIGYATALAFARANTHVVATARRTDRLEQLEQEASRLPSPHGDIMVISADVRERGAVQAAVDAALARFQRLDILVANAGVGHRGPIAGADWDDLETVLRTNIDGVIHAVQAAIPAMRAGGGGHILVVSSVQATMPGPYTATYAATKAFASSLAASLRFELAADNIWVTDLRLGRTRTEFNEKRLGAGARSHTLGPRHMSPDRVAAAIVAASSRRQKVVVLRPIDRLILLANRLVPDLVARLVIRQYR